MNFQRLGGINGKVDVLINYCIVSFFFFFIFVIRLQDIFIRNKRIQIVQKTIHFVNVYYYPLHDTIISLKIETLKLNIEFILYFLSIVPNMLK